MAPHKVEETSASKTISLLGMMNGELREKIEQLLVVFPHVDLITIRDVLVTCKGDVSEASDVLADSAGASSFEPFGASSSKPTILSMEDDDSHMDGITTNGENDKVQLLKEVCPFHAISEIRFMLSTCNGDVAAASLRLTESSPTPNGKVSMLAENPGHDQDMPERPTTSNAPVKKFQSPPSTGSLASRERYPGGVIPPFTVSTRSKTQNTVMHSETIKNESECRAHSVSVTSKSEDHIERVVGGEQSFEEKVAALHAALPRASKSRIRSILQIEENLDDAFAALYNESGLPISDEDTSSDDEDDDEADESSSDDGLPRGQKSSEGKGHKLVLVPGCSRLKRRAESESSNERTLKRRRQFGDDDDACEDDLEPAADWVKKYLSPTNGFLIVLDDGVYPSNIPKAVLDNFMFFRDQFGANVTETLPLAPITLRDVRADILDLAIQYSVCKRFKLAPAQRRNISSEISTVLDLVVLASRLGLQGSESDLTAYLKRVLLRNRDWDRDELKGQHIRTAYTLAEGHPIRRLFAQAVVRSYAEFRHKRSDDDERFEISRSESESSDLNEAQRRAWHTKTWEYNSEYCEIKDFRIDLFVEVGKMWERMDINETKLKRFVPYQIFLLDPLTRERFIL